MTYTVRILPSGREMRVQAQETLLEAALRQGLNFPYSCRDGTCATCKGRIVAGEIDAGHYQPSALSEDERQAGYALFCVSRPKSDLTVEIREIDSVKDIPVKTIPVRVTRIEDLAPEVRGVFLKTPASERLQFLAGQYVDILLKNGQRRSFSLASSPLNDEYLELNIKHIDGGEFTTHVFQSMHEKEILRIRGPLGTFFLRQDAERPIIMLATGTGFGPIKGMLEFAFAQGFSQPVCLYWGARTESDFYRLDLIEDWRKAHPNFQFIPVLSRPGPAWRGRVGYVTDAVMQDFTDFSGFDAYLCGHPQMVATGAHRFQEHGMPGERIFSDAFVFSPK